MRRKTIEKKRGVHFRTSGLYSYVRPSIQAPLQSPDAARLAAAKSPHPPRLARQLLPRQQTAPRCLAPPSFKDLGKKSLSTFATRRTVAVMARKIHRGEKSVHFRGSRPCSYVDLLGKTPQRQVAGGCTRRDGHRGEDCRLPLLRERTEFSGLTKKLAGFTPLERQRGR